MDLALSERNPDREPIPALKTTQTSTESNDETIANPDNNRQTVMDVLHQLQDVLGLPPSSDTSRLSDQMRRRYKRDGALIVCIEIESNVKFTWFHSLNPMSSISKAEMGISISILDTRKLNLPELRYALCTRDFCVIAPPPRRMNQPESDYLFRKRTAIAEHEVIPTIEQFLDRTRNIIFVGNTIEKDLSCLADRGFDFRTSVIGCLNISNLASPLSGYGSLYPWDLKTILRRIQFCPSSAPGSTVISGSDPDFSLRCVVLFAVDAYKLKYDGQHAGANCKLDMLSIFSYTLEKQMSLTEKEKEKLQQARRQWLDGLSLKEVGGSLRKGGV
jgi:hypothetical protein